MAYNDHFADRTPDLGDFEYFVEMPLDGVGGDRINAHKTPRDLADVTGVTLHQMSFTADRDRCPRITAHYCVLRDGTMVQNYEDDVYVNASNRLNGSTIAVEFSGNFRSERGRWYRPEDLGRHHLTENQALAGRWLLKYLQERLPAIRTVYAHIQAHGRKNCCGPDIWYHVGQWAIDVLGWTDETDRTWPHPANDEKDGRPVPQAWKTWDRI